MKTPVVLAKIARFTDSSMVYTCQLLDLNGCHVFAQLAATARHTTQKAICRSTVGLRGTDGTVSSGDTWATQPARTDAQTPHS